MDLRRAEGGHYIRIRHTALDGRSDTETVPGAGECREHDGL